MGYNSRRMSKSLISCFSRSRGASREFQQIQTIILFSASTAPCRRRRHASKINSTRTIPLTNAKEAEKTFSLLLEASLRNNINPFPFSIHESDDGSIVFEWIRFKRRFMVAVGCDNDESSWSYVSFSTEQCGDLSTLSEVVDKYLDEMAWDGFSKEVTDMLNAYESDKKRALAEPVRERVREKDTLVIKELLYLVKDERSIRENRKLALEILCNESPDHAVDAIRSILSYELPFHDSKEEMCLAGIQQASKLPEVARQKLSMSLNDVSRFGSKCSKKAAKALLVEHTPSFLQNIRWLFG